MKHMMAWLGKGTQPYEDICLSLGVSRAFTGAADRVIGSARILKDGRIRVRISAIQ